LDNLGNWILNTDDYFYLSFSHSDNYIRLRARPTIDNNVYKVTVRGTYRIDATATASLDYRIPLYGDPCYTALDNMDYS